MHKKLVIFKIISRRHLASVIETLIIHEPILSPVGRNIINGCIMYKIPITDLSSQYSVLLLTGERFKHLICKPHCPTWLKLADEFVGVYFCEMHVWQFDAPL